MSTPAERLYVIQEAYRKAKDRRQQDRKEATPAQRDEIKANIDRLKGHYYDAATEALDANGAAVEDAYDAATKAQREIDSAYEAAKAVAERIRLVGGVIGKVGDLIGKASGK